MKKREKKPLRKRSEKPTLTGTPPLGYLNSILCPVCKKHLFSFYDADVLPNRKDGFCFSISEDWNYCSKCGTPLDLSEWKREMARSVKIGTIVGADEIIEFE